MFRYLSQNARLLKQIRENEELRSRLERALSDIDYIAMLTDVELEMTADEEEQPAGEEENE